MSRAGKIVVGGAVGIGAFLYFVTHYHGPSIFGVHGTVDPNLPLPPQPSNERGRYR